MRLFILFFSLVVSFGAQAEIKNFSQAKTALKKHVYFDTMDAGTIYCGCKWEWKGATGGRIDHQSCGYKIRANEVRANRTEFEHIMPASSFGHQRQCWQNGGRKNCTATDPVFNKMEGDLHNLHMAVGEINADRSNFRMAMLPSTPYQHGACDFKVNFKQRAVEPRDEVKGQIARIYFYMHDRYNLNMSRQQQQLFMAWDRKFPVTKAERIRDERIAKVAGNHNPFVTGEKKWHLGFKPSGAGLSNGMADAQGSVHVGRTLPARVGAVDGQDIAASGVKGNVKSRIYHLASCYGFEKVSDANAVMFTTEAEAVKAGYRKAMNCE